MSTPDYVRFREEAAAKCTARIKRKVLKKHARNARAEHLVICCLEPVKKKTKRKPLTELYVKGHFTEDGEEWHHELQRHCDEVCTDQEETREVQENRIEYFKKKGDQQFTVEGRTAEITVDLVLQARAKMSDNKVNGPDDAMVSEVIKNLPLENFTLSRSVFKNASWARWKLQIRGRS